MAKQLSCLIVFLAFPFYQSFVETKSLDLARIQNGVEASAKQFPYQVYLRIHYDLGAQSYCGGTIISKNIILTAAHCVDGQIEGIMVYFGTVDIGNIEEKGQQRLLVKPGNIVMHREYDAAHFINDIALIKLPADLEFDEYIQPAKLPNPTELYANEDLVSSGWGILAILPDGTPVRTKVLFYFETSAVSPKECKRITQSYSPGMFIPSSYICLKLGDSRPCVGDSGGPLVKKNDDGSNTLVGITSFGIGKCSVYGPAYFTRVSCFLKWIKKTMQQFK